MPIIPDFEQAQTQTIDPTARPFGGASANDFGAQIGTAVGGMGDALTSMKKLYDQDQSNLQKFQTQKAFTDFASQEAQTFADAQRGLANGAKDFTKNFMGGAQPDAAAQPLNPDGTPGSTPSPAAGNSADAAAASAGGNGGFDGRAKAWLDANTSSMSPDEQAQWQAKVSALRSTMARQALTAEFQERDRFYKTTIGDQLQKIQTGIDQTPAALDAYKAQGLELINSSGLSAADKQAYAQTWQQNATTAYAVAQARANPAAVAADLGSNKVGYFAKINAAEGGNNPNGGNGGGPAQFMPATWTGLVNSPEGKAAGLTANGRQDPAQNAAGLRIFTAQNAQALQQNGFDPSEANLRMAHFLGAGGAVNFLSAMKANPGASAAGLFPKEAAANPSIFFTQGQNGGTARSLQDVFALQTKGFAGNGVAAIGNDPKLADLPYDQRQNVLGYAERQAQQQTAQAAAATEQQHQDFLNGLLLKIHDGSAGTSEINNARASGQLTDVGEIARAENMVAARQKGVGDLQTFGDMVSSNATFNPFDKAHRDAADAGVQALGGDPGAALKVWQRTGIATDTMTTALRGALTSKDPAQVGQAAGVVSNMLAQNPNALAGAQGQKDLESAGTTFDHLVNGLGMTAQDAGKRLIQMNTPEYQNTVKIREPDVKAFQDELRKGDPVADVRKAFDGGLFERIWRGTPPSAGLGADQRQAIGLDYAEQATDHFQQYGDKDAAKAFALQQMKKLYGVSNGVIMKYPPEHVYPPVVSDKGFNGPQRSYDYIYSQAADAIKETTGETVDPKQVYLMPLPTVTAEAWRSGQPTPYAIHYIGEQDGIPMHKTLLRPNGATPRPWVADPTKPLADGQAKDQAGFEQARARGPGTQAEDLSVYSGGAGITAPYRP